MGYRNPLGIAADERERVWASETGPKSGDELSLIVDGENEGWPNAPMGNASTINRSPTTRPVNATKRPPLIEHLRFLRPA